MNITKEILEKLKKVEVHESDCPQCGGCGFHVVPDDMGEARQQGCSDCGGGGKIGGLIEENIGYNKALNEIASLLTHQ